MWLALQSIVIGLLAPAGVWLGWYLRRRDKVSDRDRETRELLRTKAEEIYGEIEVVRQASNAAVMGALEYQFLPNRELPELVANVNRLRALVNMYFPGGAALFDTYAVAVHVPITAFSTSIATIEADLTINQAEKLKKMKEARSECAEAAAATVIELTGDLTAFMNGEVKKLL